MLRELQGTASLKADGMIIVSCCYVLHTLMCQQFTLCLIEHSKAHCAAVLLFYEAATAWFVHTVPYSAQRIIYSINIIISWENMAYLSFAASPCRTLPFSCALLQLADTGRSPAYLRCLQSTVMV